MGQELVRKAVRAAPASERIKAEKGRFSSISTHGNGRFDGSMDGQGLERDSVSVESEGTCDDTAVAQGAESGATRAKSGQVADLVARLSPAERRALLEALIQAERER
ncbi:MAG: hypothetical protein JJU36_17960 [Phycisphaeraceae bacterium]|nr:hypothetical protein [Phycisphaeraceae bacterium]